MKSFYKIIIKYIYKKYDNYKYMEKLALTCKILYDKDYLDKINLIKKEKRHPVVFFTDIFQYFRRFKEFQNKVKYEIDNLINSQDVFEELINNIENVTDNIQFIRFLRQYLIYNLYDFTDNNEKKWCIETSNIIIHAIKGGIRGLVLSLSNTNITINKENIKNITISIIFNIIGTHEDFPGLFDKISFFKCDKCKKIKNLIIYHPEYDTLCIECLDNL